MGAYPFHRFRHRLFVVVLMLLCVQVVRADNSLTVTCTNNGNGLYSYTFARGTDYYFWEVGGNSSIQIQSYGILQTFQPEGWTSSVDTNGWVVWQHPDGVAYLDQPTTFSVLSSYKIPILYNDGPPGIGALSRGILTGLVTTARDEYPIGGGFFQFPFVGPDPNSIRALSLEIVGTNAVVSWPTEMSGYVLQSSTNLSQAANWTTVTNEPTAVGTQFCVTNPISAGPMFFRLSK